MELSNYLSSIKTGKCPVCGGEDFDIYNNQHTYLTTTATDTLLFSCNCGAVWVENWRLESVLVTDNNFFKIN